VRGYAEARHEAVTGKIVMDGWTRSTALDALACTHDRSCDSQSCCKLRGGESPSHLISECTYIGALVPTRGLKIRYVFSPGVMLSSSLTVAIFIASFRFCISD
jgi:hypothetical protein